MSAFPSPYLLPTASSTPPAAVPSLLLHRCSLSAPIPSSKCPPFPVWSPLWALRHPHFSPVSVHFPSSPPIPSSTLPPIPLYSLVRLLPCNQASRSQSLQELLLPFLHSLSELHLLLEIWLQHWIWRNIKCSTSIDTCRRWLVYFTYTLAILDILLPVRDAIKSLYLCIAVIIELNCCIMKWLPHP